MNYTRDTTSGAEGLDLLTRLQALEMPPPVVVMTAWASIDGAVEAMRRGARDFIEKPWDNRRLLATLRTQVELGRALRRSQQLERENRALRREGLPELIAESPAMEPVLKLMERIGPSDANVLITGEHGTGKEVVARWLHAASRRAGGPFVAVNSGGVSEGVFESELFGHVKAPSPMPRAIASAASSWRRAAPCFSTKSPTCRSASRPSSYASCRPANSRRSAPPSCGVPMRGFCRPPTWTSAARWPKAASARISCIGSTRSRSTCRRCAIAARTFP